MESRQADHPDKPTLNSRTNKPSPARIFDDPFWRLLRQYLALPSFDFRKVAGGGDIVTREGPINQILIRVTKRHNSWSWGSAILSAMRANSYSHFRALLLIYCHDQTRKKTSQKRSKKDSKKTLKRLAKLPTNPRHSKLQPKDHF